MSGKNRILNTNTVKKRPCFFMRKTLRRKKSKKKV
nr:MAG TPA: hypothetical protein [Caudoviricetes sp.]